MYIYNYVLFCIVLKEHDNKIPPSHDLIIWNECVMLFECMTSIMRIGGIENLVHMMRRFKLFHPSK